MGRPKGTAMRTGTGWLAKILRPGPGKDEGPSRGANDTERRGAERGGLRDAGGPSRAARARIEQQMASLHRIDAEFGPRAEHHL